MTRVFYCLLAQNQSPYAFVNGSDDILLLNAEHGNFIQPRLFPCALRRISRRQIFRAGKDNCDYILPAEKISVHYLVNQLGSGISISSAAFTETVVAPLIAVMLSPL